MLRREFGWRSTQSGDRHAPPQSTRRRRISTSPRRSSTSLLRRGAASIAPKLPERRRSRFPRRKTRIRRARKALLSARSSLPAASRRNLLRRPTGASRLTSIHGAPDAKIVSSAPGVPDRVSTSDMPRCCVSARGRALRPSPNREASPIRDGQPPEKRTQAWAEKALYTPADQILVLSGNPRVADGGMVTTAKTIRINRASDDAFADGRRKEHLQRTQGATQRRVAGRQLRRFM